ncbi:ABC transporter substrate-binding protein [Promineifilum sp.]|uniref:ABC transporter substrate-binding protein n=1 Tax=Promineifilum sp. TaxID=2664178 RepID=UPI0035AEEBDC
MKHKYRIGLLLLLAALLAACAAQPGANDLQRIRLPMGYIADPQYAPLYVAVERGYFAAEGLELEFDYSFETDGIALVGAGELPLALVSGEQAILARAQGLPVVYVMEWFERYPVALVSKAEAGVIEPADLAGRVVGVPGFFGASYVGLVGLLSANGLTIEDIEPAEIGFNQVESLLSDQSEVVVVYVNNEPVQLRDQGIAINMLEVADYANLVANGVITNEDTIAQNPELVRGFVRAFLRGLQDTLDDPAAAYEISKQFVEGLDDSRRGVLDASIELWRADPLGQTDPASWTETQELLLQMGLLDAPVPDLEQMYTNDFVAGAQE